MAQQLHQCIKLEKSFRQFLGTHNHCVYGWNTVGGDVYLLWQGVSNNNKKLQRLQQSVRYCMISEPYCYCAVL